MEGRWNEHNLLDSVALRSSASENDGFVGILNSLAEIGVNILKRSDESTFVCEKIYLFVEIVCQFVMHFSQVLLV